MLAVGETIAGGTGAEAPAEAEGRVSSVPGRVDSKH